MDATAKAKWETYYNVAQTTSVAPPWESSEPFHGVVDYLVDKASMRCLELGCGSSVSSVFMAEKGHSVDAVDVCALALERAKQNKNSELVNWICADLMHPDLFETSLSTNTYDFVFDMQCFHCLRTIDEARAAGVIFKALKPGGCAMVVVGAVPPHSDPSNVDKSNAEGRPGPPQLTLEVFRCPLEAAGLTTVQISLSRMNPTPHYKTSPDGLPPLAWVGIFQKVPWDPNASYALEVQQPFSQYILRGRKSIETRAYPLPAALMNKRIYLLESNTGTSGVSSLPSHMPLSSADNAHIADTATQPSVRIIGVVTFDSCTLYDSGAAWEADRDAHMVPAGSLYDWNATTGTERFTESFLAREHISIEDGKLKELYAWRVGTIETVDLDFVPALTRVYRSIFKIEL